MKKPIRITRAEEQVPVNRQIRLPGFLLDEEIALGDLVKKTTSYLGIQPCGACHGRAEVLNRWLTFLPRNPK